MELINKTFCRVCLSDHNLINIFEGKCVKLAKKMMFCASVQLSLEDSLPKQICKQCQFYMEIAYIFRTVCESTDKKLRHNLSLPSNTRFSVPHTTKHEPERSVEGTLNPKYNMQQIKKATLIQENVKFSNRNNNVTFSFPNLIVTEEMFDEFKEKMDNFEAQNGDNCLVNVDKLHIVKSTNQTSYTAPNIINKKSDVECRNFHTDIYNITLPYDHETSTLMDESHFVNTIDLPFSEVVYNTDEICLVRNIESSAKTDGEKVPFTKNIGLTIEEEVFGNEPYSDLHYKSKYEYNRCDAETHYKLKKEDLQVSCEYQETRVGRHVAKKNAGQPPKRYSPSPDSLVSNLKSDVEILAETDTKLKDFKSQKHILEGDPMSGYNLEEIVKSANNNVFHHGKVNTLWGHTTKNKLQELHLQTNKRHLKSEHSYRLNSTKKVKINLVKQQKTKKKHNICRTKSCIKPSETVLRKIDETSIEIQEMKKNDKHYVCSRCNKRFPFRSHFIRHLNTHTRLKQYTCAHCKKQFINNYNLSVHVRQHTGDFPLKCPTCDRGFLSPSVLKRHFQSHSGKTPYKCSYCIKSFAHSSSLNLHEKMHFSRPSYICNICSKVFSYKNSLIAHNKAHLGYKAHTCRICYKSFTRNTSLIRHMSVHSQDKNFKCKKCNKSFSNHESFDKHFKIHSSFRCKVCASAFVNKSSLVKHSKQHTEVFKCKQCGKKLSSRNLLIKHLQKHVEGGNC